ncbi:MAG: prolyl oligopeptidase family serine peptidase [Patescibacteria group bacterium]|nr:prolyl oligopeptidase family serine peptidase [Patescibacteria group bacterium]
MKKAIFVGFGLILIASVTLFHFLKPEQSLLNPVLQNTPKPKPLLVYTFDNLKKTTFPQQQITIGRQINETPNSLSQMFYFSVPQSPNSPTMKKISGVLNVPKKPGTYPIIVMFRGFVPKETYQPGIGTQPSAKIFSQNGFITLAPDFLGYGESDNSLPNDFENRLQTYTTALTLLSSLSTLNNGLEASYSGKIKADLNKIGIWGHSNGGQIALSTLAISGVTYPTVLWAPVSKSFPYSILYYTDESDDQGKALRQALANFEKDYDTEQFSPSNYYQWIKAPIEINQGIADHEVPVWWSDDLVAALKKDEIDVTYFTYPGADHNLQPNGWSSAVSQSIDFYKRNF